jgi:hypothetical protein
MQNRNVGTDRDAHAAILDSPESHYRHPRPLGDQLCGKAAPKPGHANSLAKSSQPALYRGKQRGNTLRHAIILALFHAFSKNNGTTSLAGVWLLFDHSDDF